MSESEKAIWTTRFLNISFEKEVTSIVDGKHQQNTQIFQEVRVKIVFPNTGIRIERKIGVCARLRTLKRQEIYDARKKVPGCINYHCFTDIFRNLYFCPS